MSASCMLLARRIQILLQKMPQDARLPCFGSAAQSIFVHLPIFRKVNLPFAEAGPRARTEEKQLAVVDKRYIFAVLRLADMQAGRELKRKATTPTQSVGTAEEW